MQDAPNKLSGYKRGILTRLPLVFLSGITAVIASRWNSHRTFWVIVNHKTLDP
jgi:hypothetical protein